ncbi:hypothetical protein E2C01_014644 [Portunus trituberculatus]|uniref:Uncharacterized protein n=1 Tax=Portunus trituberculatus TaxID=210409 RepID=A0A5B7DJE8_PORTR|nr:hypothetical protein [Portunus trituberculatus]
MRFGRRVRWLMCMVMAPHWECREGWPSKCGRVVTGVGTLKFYRHFMLPLSLSIAFLKPSLALSRIGVGGPGCQKLFKVKCTRTYTELH